MKIKLDKYAFMPVREHITDAGLDIRAIDDEEWMNCKCPICGKQFHLKPSKKSKGLNHYCSRECHRIAKMDYMSGEKNHQYGLRLDKNASWKGGKKITRYGYYIVKQPDHPFSQSDGYILEHRLVAEKYLLNDENCIVVDGKKYLSPKYLVHHKNKNRLDNRPENLEVMMKADHARLHSKELNKHRLRNRFGQYI